MSSGRSALMISKVSNSISKDVVEQKTPVKRQSQDVRVTFAPQKKPKRPLFGENHDPKLKNKKSHVTNESAQSPLNILNAEGANTSSASVLTSNLEQSLPFSVSVRPAITKQQNNVSPITSSEERTIKISEAPFSTPVEIGVSDNHVSPVTLVENSAINSSEAQFSTHVESGYTDNHEKDTRDSAGSVRPAINKQENDVSPITSSEKRTINNSESPLSSTPVETGVSDSHVNPVTLVENSVINSSEAQFSTRIESGYTDHHEKDTLDSARHTYREPNAGNSSSISQLSTPNAVNADDSTSRSEPPGPKPNPKPSLSSERTFSLLTPLDGSWLRRLLVKFQEGRVLLQFYDQKKHLTASKRCILVKLIILSELEEDVTKQISHERFSSIAEAIPQCFEYEAASTYFVPYHKDLDGVRYLAKGKLYDRYVFVKRGYRKDGIILGKQKFGSHDSNVDKETVEVDPALEAKRRVLKTKVYPWLEVEDNWKLTHQIRLDHFKKHELEISDYFTLYPAFKEKKAYTLLDIDFNQLHPSQGDSLSTNWEDFEDNLISLGKRSGKKITNWRIDLTLEDSKSKTINSFLLLAALLPNGTVSKTWRTTKGECIDAFLLFGDSEEDIDERYNNRLKNLAENNKNGAYPVVVVVGSTTKYDVFIRIKDFYLQCDSVLQAVDSCFKIFKTLKLEFPKDCALPWSFLEEYVYKINTNLHSKFVSLGTLMADLKSFSSKT